MCTFLERWVISNIPVFFFLHWLGITWRVNALVKFSQNTCDFSWFVQIAVDFMCGSLFHHWGTASTSCSHLTQKEREGTKVGHPWSRQMGTWAVLKGNCPSKIRTWGFLFMGKEPFSLSHYLSPDQWGSFHSTDTCCKDIWISNFLVNNLL